MLSPHAKGVHPRCGGPSLADGSGDWEGRTEHDPQKC